MVRSSVSTAQERVVGNVGSRLILLLGASHWSAIGSVNGANLLLLAPAQEGREMALRQSRLERGEGG